MHLHIHAFVFCFNFHFIELFVCLLDFYLLLLQHSYANLFALIMFILCLVWFLVYLCIYSLTFLSSESGIDLNIVMFAELACLPSVRSLVEIFVHLFN